MLIAYEFHTTIDSSIESSRILIYYHYNHERCNMITGLINIAFEYEVQDGRVIKHELHPALVPDVLNAIIEYNPVSLSEHDIMLAAVIMY